MPLVRVPERHHAIFVAGINLRSKLSIIHVTGVVEMPSRFILALIVTGGGVTYVNIPDLFTQYVLIATEKEDTMKHGL